MLNMCIIYVKKTLNKAQNAQIGCFVQPMNPKILLVLLVIFLIYCHYD